MADYDASSVLTGNVGSIETELEGLSCLPTSSINGGLNFSSAAETETTVDDLEISGLSADEVLIVYCMWTMSGSAAHHSFRLRLRTSTTALTGYFYYREQTGSAGGTVDSGSLLGHVRGDAIISDNINLSFERVSGSGTFYVPRIDWKYYIFKVRS